MKKFKCEICNEEFDKSQQKSNHVRWHHKDEEFLKNFRENQKKGFEKRLNNKLGEIKIFKVNCEKCKSEFEVNEREKQFPLKEKYYCSRSCANSRITTGCLKKGICVKCKREIDVDKRTDLNRCLCSDCREESRKLKAIKPKEIWICPVCNKELKLSPSQIKNRKYCSRTCLKRSSLPKEKCLECNKDIIMYRSNKRFCNRECYKKFYLKKRAVKVNYQWLSNFKFSLSQFSKEFDFSLIEKHGWYKPTNKGNNLDGVSRDHMFSVYEGMSQNINPLLLAHPVNCKLMLHVENNLKKRRCSIILLGLLERINNWEIKYGSFYKEKQEIYCKLDNLNSLDSSKD